MRRSPSTLALGIVLVLLAAGCTTDDPGSGRAREPEVKEKGGQEELQEQAEKTEKRLEALEEARRAGTLGVIERIQRAKAPGWVGERIVNDTGDDWEPAIAADPNAPYVYILHNRYGGERACSNSCPDPAMILHVSADGGKTWGKERFLCTCRRVQGQFDPLIEVVPDTGEVYAVWMNDYKIHFSKSSDHGKTWSEPTPVFGKVAWGDKPNMGIGDDGQDVYIAFNGPTGGDPWVAASHDGGETWTQTKVVDSRRYFFAYGGHVADDGTVTLSHISFDYSGPAGAAVGPIQIHVLRSTDDGASWSDVLVDTLEFGSPCTSTSCYADFYDSGPALAADEDDDLVLVYNGAAGSGGPRTVYARSSTDDGATWSSRVQLSLSGVNSAFPAAAGTGDDEVRAYFKDQRTGRWNVWYTTSRNLGRTWSTPVRISDAISGTAYKDANGFLEVYGDYGELAITSAGKTVAVWGEGTSYFGPGGVWFNRQR